MRIKLDCPLSLSEISSAIKSSKIIFKDDRYIEFISTDTRDIYSGDLFFALTGENFNGEDFVSVAKNNGAYTVSSRYSDADFFVSDTALALYALAYYYKKKLPFLKSTVAITGSVGKSTTKNLISEILSVKYNTHSTYKNFNNEIGVPITVLSANRNTEILVIEAGMNHPGELERISRCIEPDISIITKIGTSHIGNFGSRRKIAEAKLEILAGMKIPFALIPFGEPLLSTLNFAKTVSVSEKNADFCLFEKNNELFDFYSSSNNIIDLTIHSRLSHIPQCMAFALAAVVSLNMNCDEIRNAISDIDFESFSVLYKIGNLTIIDDSYNSSAESVEMALKTLLSTNSKNKSAVLGDMLELGDMSEILHIKIGALAANAKLSRLYAIGKYAKFIKEGAAGAGMSEKNIFINENPDDTGTTANQIICNSDCDTIILKASRKLRLEQIVEHLKEKIQRGTK